MLEGSRRGESGPEPIAASSIRRLSEDQSHAQSALEYQPCTGAKAGGRRAGVLGLALALFVLAGASSAFAAPPHRILSDEVLRDSDSMTPAQIQAYLNKQPGRLKSLVTSDYDTTITVSASSPNVNLTPDTDGVKKPASLIIWEACQQWNINPKVMLTMLQKEQSLLTRTSLTSTTLARAIGAGCPNGTTNKYPGFGNQMWHGARLLDGYGEGRVKYVASVLPRNPLLGHLPAPQGRDLSRTPSRRTSSTSTTPASAATRASGTSTASRFGNPIWPAVTKSTSTRITGRSSVKARKRPYPQGQGLSGGRRLRQDLDVPARPAADGRARVRRGCGWSTAPTATSSEPPRRARGVSSLVTPAPRRQRSAISAPRARPRAYA